MIGFRKPLVLTRTAEGTFIKGIDVPGATTQTVIHASVQPIATQDRQVLPEGIRENSKYVLFSNDLLRSSNKNTKEPADIVEIDGRNYTVLLVESWANGLIQHYRAIVGVNP